MLSDLTIAYLFFGGTGAGSAFVGCVLDIFWARDSFGAQAPCSYSQAPLPRRCLALVFAASFVCLVVGALCLTLDLGRVDRLESLFTNASFTYLSFGSFVLAGLMACSALLCAVRILYVPSISRVFVVAAEALTLVIAFAVMAYTGLLLCSLSAVDAWSTPLVPVLFVLSSLSCGIAVALLLAFADGFAQGAIALPRALVVADALIIALELAFAIAYGATVPSCLSFSSLQQSSANQLAFIWWICFMLVGLALPFALELAAPVWPKGQARQAFVCIAMSAVLVLAGGALLRVCVVGAAEHSALSLSAPAQAQSDQANSEGEWVL